MKKILLILATLGLVASIAFAGGFSGDTIFFQSGSGSIKGDVALIGTTPKLTIGDAGAEDTVVVYDGNAQDFYIGLDDTDDDLKIGVGSTVGTTVALSFDEDQVTTFVGGSIKLDEDTTAVNTLTASECGKVIYLNSATEFATTLPLPSSGCYFKFYIKAAPSGANYTIATSAGADIMIGHVNEIDDVSAGVSDDNADVITFVGGTSIVGDSCEMDSDGTSWYFNCTVGVGGGITTGTT